MSGGDTQQITEGTFPMTSEHMAAAFNEWMREYIEDPAAFEAEFQSVIRFQASQDGGAEPTYGQACAGLIESYHKRLSNAAQKA